MEWEARGTWGQRPPTIGEPMLWTNVVIVVVVLAVLFILGKVRGRS